jgi:hypothetical protein
MGQTGKHVLDTFFSSLFRTKLSKNLITIKTAYKKSHLLSSHLVTSVLKNNFSIQTNSNCIEGKKLATEKICQEDAAKLQKRLTQMR